MTTPLSTYRLQLRKEFGFDAAARVVPYLKSLGITHVYTSPFFTARPGSAHGYDVVDHRTLNPEFGGEAGFARLSAALKAAELGLILDFVPNHMAIGSGNAWWMDVLEWGQKSPRAAAFDISWELLPYRPRGGVLLPVLGKPYGEALTAGEIALKYDAVTGSFSAWYFDQRFPINPERYGDIIKTAVAAAQAEQEQGGRGLLALADENARPGQPSYAAAPELKRRLAGIQGAAPIIERGLVAYRTDHEAGVNALHRLMERQHYRLADWRLAVSGINYRRFFDINELAGLRIEDLRTFRDTHELVTRLVAADQLQGLRLDHIDGLLDPAQYTSRLQQLVRSVRGGKRKPFYVVMEKILADGEPMPALAGVAGTTGYEWLNTISRVLVDPAGRDKLDALWRETAPALADFAVVLENAKLRILDTVMASEFSVLVQLLSRIAAGHFSTRDYAADRLREALRLYILEFPLYRTYVTAAGCSANDRAIIERTIAAARARWQGTDADIFNFLRDALTLDLIDKNLPYSRPRVRNFALKMQQFTGPMAAKSLEDTALYRYHALLGLNEVGGHPTLPALSVSDFHERVAARVKQSPHGMTATATHDTKRGEDARTRILALSECPELWAQQVAEWRRRNAGFVCQHKGVPPSPSPGHETMLYQTLVGAWLPGAIDKDFIQRIEDYAIKAAREGKLETSWLNPDEAYEDGLRAFIRAVLDRDRAGAFLESFENFARRMALLGALNSLTQLVLKTTIPGVPDVYQGTETWDLSLVDPDNRRPVDFAARQAALDATAEPDWTELAASWTDGRLKLALTHRLLALRNLLPAVFRDGIYEPVEVTGPDCQHIVAFRRSMGRHHVVVAVGRHFAGLTDVGQHWPNGGWKAELCLDRRQQDLRDALGSDGRTCQSLEISRLFAVFPIAVLRN